HCPRNRHRRRNVSHGPPSSGPSRRGSVMVWMPDMSTAWREVQDHDRRRFEVADALGFADGGPDGRDWSGGPWAAEGRLHRPARIPKADGGTRVLCVLDPAFHARF